MAQLGARITKLESTRPNPAQGVCVDDLSPEIRAAMAAAYADFLDCAPPDPDTYFRAIVARMNEAEQAGKGIESLEGGDLAAIIAAYHMVNT